VSNGDRVDLSVLLEDVSLAFGPQQPVASSPARAPRSARRTTTIDCARPHGLTGPESVLAIEGRARDLVTDAAGTARPTDAAEARLLVDGTDRSLRALESDPAAPALQGLLGALVGPGFRGRVAGIVPYARAGTAPLFALLDDVPGAALVSGYALQHAGVLAVHALPDAFLDAQVDLCAGWAGDASMMQIIRASGHHPVSRGPVAPSLELSADPDAWHERPALAPHSTRRARRLDVVPSDDASIARIDAFFRDSHVSGDGTETVVHEYQVHASVDTRTRTIVTIDAAADVLPWMECPSAVASALRLAGTPVRDLRPRVRESFTGTSTCTHLNDVLRSLADVDRLLDLVP
jgi:hypothetical protein